MSSPTRTPTATQETPSVCEDWQLAEDKEPNPQNLVVQQRKYVFVFPYFRLVWSEGDNNRVVVNFVTHQVVINGYGLAALLAALAAQKVRRVMEPLSNEAKFRKGPIISDIAVLLNKDEEEES